jgi:hypothetical protein
MTPNLDEKMSSIAGQVLKRPLSDEEKLEIYKISDAMGMTNVQSFLHQLLIFKLHEDTMKKQFERLVSLEIRLNEKFEEMGSLSARTDDTLGVTVDKILREGMREIGRDMGHEVAAGAKDILSSSKEFHIMRGYIVTVAVVGVISTVAYWLGVSDILRMDKINGPWEAVLLLPAGWWLLFCCAAYTYFWCFDHWEQVKRSIFFKVILALQTLVMAGLLTFLL